MYFIIISKTAMKQEIRKKCFAVFIPIFYNHWFLFHWGWFCFYFIWVGEGDNKVLFKYQGQCNWLSPSSKLTNFVSKFEIMIISNILSVFFSFALFISCRNFITTVCVCVCHSIFTCLVEEYVPLPCHC